MMRPRPRLRAAIIALLAGLLLTACGTTGNVGSPSPKAEKRSPLEALTLVSAKTSEAQTAKLAFTVKTSGAGSQAQTVRAQGVADFTAKRFRMTMRVGGEKVDMVMIGTTMYMRMPGQELVPGKSWLKLDLVALSKAAGTDLSSLTRGASNDPTQALALLKGVSSGIKEVGREQVRGADTTHYKATIDLRKAAERQGSGAKKQLEQVLEQAEAQSLPADVWIDDQGRLRKMQYALRMRVKGTGQQRSVAVSTTMELFDFGTTAKIGKPPASQVADFTELLQGSRSSG
jgi:hypothetical protein